MSYLVLIIVAALSCSICTEARLILGNESKAVMTESQDSKSNSAELHHDGG